MKHKIEGRIAQTNDGLVNLSKPPVPCDEVAMDPIEFFGGLLELHGAKRDGVTVWVLPQLHSAALCGRPEATSAPRVTPWTPDAADEWAWREATGDIARIDWRELLKRVATHADAHGVVCAVPRIYPRQRKLTRAYDFDQQRPATAMQLGLHFEVGQLLKFAYSRAPEDAGVHEKLAIIQIHLHEWVSQEYEVSADGATLIYDPWPARHQRAADHCAAMACVQALHQARGLLVVGYIDCPPLSDTLKRLDVVIGRLRRYAASTHPTGGCKWACEGLSGFIGGQA